MAMRLYTREQFFTALRQNGFSPVEEGRTRTHQLWTYRDGKAFPVPVNQDRIPDHILDAFLSRVGEIYNPAPHMTKAFTVEEDRRARLRLVEEENPPEDVLATRSAGQDSA